MAALHYAADTTTTHPQRRFTSETLNSRTQPMLLISSSFTAKPTRRKNHLRQKILKTLDRPIIPKLLPSNPIILIGSPPFQEKESDSRRIHEIQEYEKSENAEAGNEEVKKIEEMKEIEVSVPSGLSLDGNLAKPPIFKYGLWLIGAFVFQIVCAIWVFSSAGTDNKNQISNGTEKSSVIEVEGNGEGKSRVKFVLYGNGNGKMGVENSAPGSIVYVNELEMERKIDEIRVLTRKTREMERLESKKSGPYDSVELNGEEYFKNGIEVEVDERLIKLIKNLEKARGKMPVASLEYLRKQNEMDDQVEKGDLDERESNGGLLFKKKYKFKGVSTNLTEKPKGFVGSDNTRFRSRKEKKGNGVAKPKVKDGIAVKSRKSSALDIAVASDELSKGNDSLEGKGVGDATLALKGESGTGFWWSSLPYVLVIVMRRGHDEGFYTLKSISSTNDQISHMVAFEDRRDATNFCYLLQSFFEDLQDFNADIVPLTVKELNEAAKYYSSMRVVVVKGGQVQLYAGQPLPDAEMTLRAMI